MKLAGTISFLVRKHLFGGSLACTYTVGILLGSRTVIDKLAEQCSMFLEVVKGVKFSAKVTQSSKSAGSRIKPQASCFAYYRRPSPVPNAKRFDCLGSPVLQV